MKIRHKGIILLLFTIGFFGTFHANAQCRDNTGVFKCATVFNDDKVAYLNDFKLSQKGSTLEKFNGQEWEIYLMKGVKYRFALCCYEGIENLVFKLYDKVSSAEEKPINSTFQEGADRAYFDFECKASQVYYVSLRTKNGSDSVDKICAIGLLGFIGKVGE
ncbi:MAG: hypothetical protein U9N85_07855 [Bacteroidota bacterium]|nr:hypothetical protein [Bacteroidota bacterium]